MNIATIKAAISAKIGMVAELIAEFRVVTGIVVALAAAGGALGFSYSFPLAWAADVKALSEQVQEIKKQGEQTSVDSLRTRKTVLEGQLFDVEMELQKNPSSRALRMRKKELEDQIADIDRQIEAKGKH